MIRVFNILLFFFLLNCTYAKISEADSLIQLVNSTKEDTVLLKLYNDIGSATYKVDQNLAKIYWTKGKELGTRLIEKNRDKNVLKELAVSHNGLGIIDRRKGNYPEALAHYQKCLKISEEIDRIEDVGSTFMNIGIIYRDLKEYDKAKEYYDKSLTIRERLKDTLSLAGAYNAYGILYRKMEDYQKALSCYHKSLEFSAILKDDENVAQSYNNIGVIYVMKEDYDSAIIFFNKGFELHAEKNNEAGIARYYANMCQVYSQLGQVHKAISYGEQASKLYDSMGRKNDLSDVAHKLSQLYTKTKSFENALKYYKRYIVLRDSVFNENNLREITQKEMQFDFDKKMLADSLARAEEEKIKELEYNQQLKQQKTITYSGAIILLIVIVFSAIIFKRLKISNKQKAIIEEQKLIVETKNQEIVDSINYAKRIQTAILPSIDKIKKSLPNSFVLYQPKDIVAGDFYWYFEKAGKVLIAVADCTGHGVPGAMVSVVCNNALNRAVNDFMLIEPSKILDKTAELVREAFEKSGDDVKDGMDISLCSFDLKNNELEYAGAINSLFYISENKLTEVKGDKQPIGQYASVQPFTNHKIKLNKGDKIYMFSDGYSDQFGGEKGKKYMYKKFRDLIISSSADFSNQKEKLLNEFDSWKGNLEQLDDVCIIGIRV